MANRFGDEYRPMHSGDSVFWNSRPMQSPFKKTNSAIWDWRSPPPAGGAKVPAKPKGPTPKGSGGVARALPSGLTQEESWTTKKVGAR